MEEMKTRPTYLAEIVHRVATDMGYTDASGQGAGGVWLTPNSDGISYVWRLQWPNDIVEDLVSFKNPSGRITNSDLELAALVLQEATFPSISDQPAWRSPTSGSDNTPTVSWTFKEASIVNPVVADLLRIRSTINRTACITPSVFYHPGILNTIADDALRRFDLSHPYFLSFFFLPKILQPITVGKFMADMPPALRRDFVSDLCAAKTAVRGGHVSSSRTSNL